MCVDRHANNYKYGDGEKFLYVHQANFIRHKIVLIAVIYVLIIKLCYHLVLVSSQ